MKKVLIVTVSLVMSFMMLFAFTACGSSGNDAADQAVKALDETLSALKSADVDAIKELSNSSGEASEGIEETFGSEDSKVALKCMFGHFDYTLGKPEVVDETNVNIPATVTNADMSQAVNTWFTNVITYSTVNKDELSDQDAMTAKFLEMLQEAVDTTAKSENGMVTNDVMFPMTLKGDKWEINTETIDSGVFDAITGGFVSAFTNMMGGAQ